MRPGHASVGKFSSELARAVPFILFYTLAQGMHGNVTLV